LGVCGALAALLLAGCGGGGDGDVGDCPAGNQAEVNTYKTGTGGTFDSSGFYISFFN
jgi:hypothetical protein